MPIPPLPAVSAAPAPPPAPANPDAWTTRRLLAWIGGALKQQGVDSPRLCAEILLAWVLNCDRLKLYIEPERVAEPAELARLRPLVSRALKHEPIQYLTGEGWFFGLPFTVDARVLIPRPSTETIVEDVIQAVRRAARERAAVARDATAAAAAPTSPGDEPAAPAPAVTPPPLGEALRIADVATGSGCIAIALAKNLPGAALVATDISPAALEVAAINARRHAVASRVELRAGDMLAPLTGGLFDFIVSNPPYIPDHEWDAVEKNVKDFEPASALRGGPDGLAFVRPIIDNAMAFLRPGGTLMIEIAAVTADAVASLAHSQGWLHVRVLNDGEGLPRVLRCQRP